MGQEESMLRGAIAETEATIQRVQQDSSQLRADIANLSQKLEALAAESQRSAAAVAEACRARRSDDLAFEAVQAELQAAFRHREALFDEFASHTQARHRVAALVREQQPLASVAAKHAMELEANLAQSSRQLQEELAEQCRLQQQLTAAAPGHLQSAERW